MNTHARPTLFSILALMLFAFTGAASAKDKTLNDGVKGALAGKEVKWVKVDGHTFHVKPAQIVRKKGGTVSITGQISHHLRFRPDDQVNYVIVKKGDKIIQADITGIERGGMQKLVGTIDKDAAKIVSTTGKLIDGTWEGACRHIIGSIAISAK